jgi:hypothetical protein
VAGAVFAIIDGDILATRLEATGQAARKIARGALKAGGSPMLAAIQSRIHDVSGLLRRGLRLRAGRGDWQGRYSMLISSWTTRETFAKKKPGAKVAPGGARDRYRVYYGIMVEYGHRNAHGGGQTPEHPFVRPGFDATAESTGQLVEQMLLDGIDAAF